MVNKLHVQPKIFQCLHRILIAELGSIFFAGKYEILLKNLTSWLGAVLCSGGFVDGLQIYYEALFDTKHSIRLFIRIAADMHSSVSISISTLLARAMALT